MKRKKGGVLLILVALVLTATYVIGQPIFSVRQNRGALLSLSPGETYTFSFDVFPVASDVRYLFDVESGAPASVVIQATDGGDTYIGSMTPLYGSNGLPAGTYAVSISNPMSQSISVVRYDVMSSGFPNGTVGAAVYSLLGSTGVAVAAVLSVLVGLHVATYAPTSPSPYCPYCGTRSNDQRCPQCGLPRPLVPGRMGDAR